MGGLNPQSSVKETDAISVRPGGLVICSAEHYFHVPSTQLCSKNNLFASLRPSLVIPLQYGFDSI